LPAPDDNTKAAAPLPLPERGRLTVSASPESAKVRLLNSKQEYRPGVTLVAGNYREEISAPGYETQERDIALNSNEHKWLEMKLERSAVPVPATSREEPAQRAEPGRKEDGAGKEDRDLHKESEHLTRRGQMFVEQGLIDAAMTDFDQALALDPSNREASIRRSEAAERRSRSMKTGAGRPAPEEKGDGKTTGSGLSLPVGIQADLNEGQRLIDQKKCPEAIQVYSRVIALDPNSSRALFKRGFARGETGDKEGAFGDYTKALALDANCLYCYNNRGNILRDRGEYTAAIADYGKALEIESRNALVLSNRGWAYVKKTFYPEAIEDYTAAIAIDPGKANLYNDRGVAYWRNRQYKRAEDDFAKALQLEPNHPHANKNMEGIRSKALGW
jgi:tetratricopeptide (TPR) repeat protein